MFDARTRRSTARLSAAVVSAGLLTAGLAAPALASDTPQWDIDHGRMSGYFFNVSADDATQATFQTYFGYDPSDLTLTVAPSDAAGTPTGDAVAVPFTAVDPIDGGVVDVLQTRRALGEAGTGPVVYRVSAGDTVLEMAMVLGPDADLSDQQGGKVLALVNPQDSSVSDLPLTWTSQAQMAPGVSAMAFGHTVPQEVWDTSRPEVIRSAQHGEVYVLTNSAEHRMVAWYIPTEGYTGPDSFTVGFFSDHVAHLLTVEVEVGAPITGVLADVPDAADGVVEASRWT